jgi:hypothetical protein
MRVAANTDAEESVSLKAGTEHDYVPQYVTITVRSTGLPADLAAYAGKAVYRDGTDLYLDGTATKLPATATQHIEERPIAMANLTLRDLKPGEISRSNFKFDWSGSGGIQPTPIDIGWWGHCHIEAPLAALGVEAKNRVTYYSASSQKEVGFDQHRANDLLFALLDANSMFDPTTRTRKSIDETTFVGSRNDSLNGFADQIRIQAGGRTHTFEGRLHQIYRPGDGSTPVDQTFLFQPRIPSEAGLAANPEFLRAESGDVHVISGNRKIVAEIKFLEWDANGMTKERRQQITLDPSQPTRVLLGSQMDHGSGQEILTKYYWNMKGNTLESLRWQAVRGRTFEPRLLNTVDPGTAPAGEEFAGVNGMPRFDVLARNVHGFDLAREVQNESANEITAFLEDAVRHNKGAVVETSPDGPVWNFPMRNARVSDVTAGNQGTFHNLDRSFETVNVEANGKSAKVTRTRGPDGKVKDAEFHTSFLDFAWRPEKWSALPFAEGAVNYDALSRGYLTGRDSQGRRRFTTELFGMASDVLYLSMLDAHASQGEVWGIRRADGKLEHFDNRAEYEARKTELAASTSGGN